MQPNLDGSLADSQRARRLTSIHLFDVSEKYNVTVDLRKFTDSLAQQLTQFLALQGLIGHLPPTGKDGRRVVARVFISVCIERILPPAGDLAQAPQPLIAGNR